MDSKQPTESPQRKLPSIFYNGTTVAGAILAGLSFLLILFLMLVEAFSAETSPYMGIIAFVILPVFLILGLLVLAFGALRERRRRARGESVGRMPTINLNDSSTRFASILFVVGTVIFLGMSAFGSFKAYEYTESDEFCGTTCHTVMQPEYTAYNNSPHARVGCVKCHIGPGATWFVRSKLSGAYQLYAVAANVYPRPIHTPIKNLRPSRDTCEQCHWPEVFYSDEYIVHDYYSSEKDNKHFRLHLIMKTGGAHSETGHVEGIHWHSNKENKVEYVTTDERREDIPWVRSTTADGVVKVFRSTEETLDDAALAEHETRTMDCLDCHNRPSHRYGPPDQLVNRAISAGRISKELPGIKGIVVDALEGKYADPEEAEAGVPAAVLGKLKDQDQALANQAAETAWELYRLNYFPLMKTSWKAFPEHIGHLYTNGCFRCHDGLHETEDGEVIPRDCNSCHTIAAQEFDDGSGFVALGGHDYVHPEDIDGAWREMNCSECHAP